MLLLDSEALSALARGPAKRRDRVRAIVAATRSRELPVATVAAVLAEVIRGRPADAALFAALKSSGLQVLPVDSRVGVRAGQLLGRARYGSDRAVDAFLVAAADLAGGGVIATTDVRDLSRIATGSPGVRIANINP